MAHQMMPHDKARADVVELANDADVYRQFDQGWRGRSRYRNKPGVVMGPKETDCAEVDYLREMVGERYYLGFRREEQTNVLDEYLGALTFKGITASETDTGLFRKLLTKMIDSVIHAENIEVVE
ncbi:hypothetical protein ACHAPT_005547 [Fusarium lateritium]